MSSKKSKFKQCLPEGVFDIYLELFTVSEDFSQTSPMIVVQNISQQPQQDDEVIAKISNFVEQMRVKYSESEEDDRRILQSSVAVPGLEDTQKMMEQVIIETEKFRATVEKPPGRDSFYSGKEKTLLTDNRSQTSEDPRQVIDVGCSDDDFFHLICYIDTTLQRKIEQGHYI